MTRKSERELERAVDDLDLGQSPRTPSVVEFFAADSVEPTAEAGHYYLDGELVQLPWLEELTDR